MPSASALHQLRQQLTPHQWRLLLKAGLCVACQLALRETEEEDPFDVRDEPLGCWDVEEDYGRPFPEERD